MMLGRIERKQPEHRVQVCDLDIGMGQPNDLVTFGREGLHDVGPELTICARDCDLHRAAAPAISGISISLSRALKTSMLE